MKNYITYAAILLSFSAMFVGCSISQNKAIKKHALIAHKYPEIPAKYCADHYDNTEYQKDSIVYIEGETFYDTSYVTVDCDSLLSYVGYSLQDSDKSGKQSTFKVPCPPCPNRVDTFYKYNTEIRQNKAALELLQGKYDKMQDDRDNERDKRVLWTWIGCIAIGFILISTVIKWLWKKFTFNIF